MKITTKIIIFSSSLFIIFLSLIFIIPTNKSFFYINNKNGLTYTKSDTDAKSQENNSNKKDEKVLEDIDFNSLDLEDIKHINTPKIIKGIYITENTFADVSKMNEILKIASSTEINSMVIDVVSDGGPLFLINKNIAKARLYMLHNKGLYLVARVVALNDEHNGWYDPLSEKRRQQLVNISGRAISAGFDEINFDYMRYPGPSEPQIFDVPISERTKNITSLFKFLKENVRDKFNRPISMDIFGSTFIYPESNIGQSMEEAVKYFDYVMPMPYPSHWANWSFGYKNPGEHPYEVVRQALEIGWNKVKNIQNRIAKLRIWVQDFNLKSITPITYLEYTPEMVHQQIYACYYVKCSGWILWNPNNNYNKEYFNIPQSPEKYPSSPPKIQETNSTSTHSTTTKNITSTSTSSSSTSTASTTTF